MVDGSSLFLTSLARQSASGTALSMAELVSGGAGFWRGGALRALLCGEASCSSESALCFFLKLLQLSPTDFLNRWLRFRLMRLEF